MNCEGIKPREVQRKRFGQKGIKEKWKKVAKNLRLGDKKETEGQWRFGWGVYQTVCVFASFWELMARGQNRKEGRDGSKGVKTDKEGGSSGEIWSRLLESVSLNILALAFSTTMDKRAKWLIWNLFCWEKQYLDNRTRAKCTNVCQSSLWRALIVLRNCD